MPINDHPEWLLGITPTSTSSNTVHLDMLNGHTQRYRDEMDLWREVNQQIQMNNRTLAQQAEQIAAQQAPRKRSETEMLRDRVEEVCKLGRYL